MTMTPAKRVLLIGWDAADWKVAKPLMEAGKMPHLSKFVEQGVMGNMATLQPPYSPMLWTSIATGVRPFKHGVLGFTEPTPDGQGVMPVSNLSRKVRAIWNILHLAGKTCNVVGWWPSYPAEPIRGVMVSEHFQHATGPLDKEWVVPDGCVHPVELRDTLAELRINPNELVPDHLLPFIPKALEIDQAKDVRLAGCMRTLAETATVQSTATWLIQNRPWDFMAVYFDGIDHFGHGFMKYHPPRREFIKEADFELYSNVISQAYIFHDMMLGELLRLAGEDTTVILMSDHGFHSDHLRPKHIPREPAGPAMEHRDFGIFAMKGPGIKQDQLIHGACLLDVTPTLLTLFGLPIGADMDGRPLLQAFEQAPDVQYIPSWEEVPGDDGRLAADRRMDPLAAKVALDQLVALGYVEKPGEDRAESVARTIRELRFNLAQSYRNADRQAEALEILRELHTGEPDEFRFALQRAWSCLSLGKLSEMREVLDDLGGRRRQLAEDSKIALKDWREEIKRRREARQAERKAEAELKAEVELAEGAVDLAFDHPVAESPVAEPAVAKTPDSPKKKPDPLLTKEELAEVNLLNKLHVYYPHAHAYLTGQLKLAEGDFQGALESWSEAGTADAERPGLYIQLGEAYLGLKRWDDAEQNFRKALQVDPDNPYAHLGLCRCDLPRRRNRAAAESALEAIQRLYNYPLAHYCLGLALARMRQPERAAEALRMAIAINPNFAQAHRRLSILYARAFRDPEKAKVHRELALDIEGHRVNDLPRDLAKDASVGVAEESGMTRSELAAVHGLVVSSDGVTSLADWIPPSSTVEGFVTVVAGLPRSGTSMMMQMIHAGGIPVMSDDNRPPDIDNPRGYLEYAPAKRLHLDASWLGDARGKALKVVAQLVPHLSRNHEYRILLIQRDLNEVMASQRIMLDRIAQSETPQSPETVRREYSRQMRRLRVWLERQPNVRTLLLSYHEVIKGSRGTAELIARFLEMPLDIAAMANTVDASLHRQKSHAVAGS